ncbi:uncharacterized SAM-binding protein YcdF (DUF218 family) [Kribbella amoyensis]|uniref:Uncharacterized SAM-binding protein YcdF (DUF218 family) n=1 Tax=Kribbella amoyensis TaxID=996641 RepID=A0A561BUR4_9ACTN|nr:YdcF family protein [Kribbella amoyensis]TWD82635.1 uncharacterized SAM-binding protein YcdF (DUF218 family) [Kribbella amoyensis]
MTANEDLEVLSAYLARRDDGALTEPADVIVLMGSAVVESVEVVADAYRRGIAPRILVSGGIGHSTRHLVEALAVRGVEVAAAGRAEAEIFADLLRRDHAVPDAALVVEPHSTNCGENATYTRRLIDRPQRLVLIQDPTMQRRTHASFERAFADLRGTELRSHAAVVPSIGPDQVGAAGNGPPIWSRERFTSLLLGEVYRLRETGYGPLGRNFIDRVELPATVLAAFHRLSASRPPRPAGGD